MLIRSQVSSFPLADSSLSSPTFADQMKNCAAYKLLSPVERQVSLILNNMYGWVMFLRTLFQVFRLAKVDLCFSPQLCASMQMKPGFYLTIKTIILKVRAGLFLQRDPAAFDLVFTLLLDKTI